MHTMYVALYVYLGVCCMYVCSIYFACDNLPRHACSMSYVTQSKCPMHVRTRFWSFLFGRRCRGVSALGDIEMLTLPPGSLKLFELKDKGPGEEQSPVLCVDILMIGLVIFSFLQLAKFQKKRCRPMCWVGLLRQRVCVAYFVIGHSSFVRPLHCVTNALLCTSATTQITLCT